MLCIVKVDALYVYLVNKKNVFGSQHRCCTFLYETYNSLHQLY